MVIQSKKVVKGTMFPLVILPMPKKTKLYTQYC